ncbi:hypothetical protein BDV95DRAFT_500806 [Massariosphaeria phaeospora]|uniref:Ribosomal lysine N-methyltransferase 4 n=1 Tax=Massariosphaeria phaeospora TaxID=100035 RepID=A0A7C8IAD7_9PLEO|nr:hypothetical protein BDV95DRAFT_500806 [Massariosphaeria phaeospora]
MATFDEASQSFLVWLTRSGADINPKIELKDLRSAHAGRGVVAANDVEVEELLFRLPRSAILSVENSILYNEIPKVTFEELGPWLSLILVMLYEYQNQDASNWASYFRVLPSEFNTLMFWEDDELAELQASAVRGKIGTEGADRLFVEQLIPVIREFAEVFFAGDPRAKERAEEMLQPQNILLMRKMGSLIMAYAFDVEPAVSHKEVDEEGYVSEDEDEALPKGMVPLADMLNADAERNNARLFYEEDCLSMKAIKPIQAGEEIFNDYGPLPRSDLLRRYGYITDNYAEYDVVEIPMDLVTQTASAAGINSKERLDYLEEHDILDTGYDIYAKTPFDLDGTITPYLVVLIEALLLPADEFERLKQKNKLPKEDKISAAGAAMLLQLVRARAQQYPTSLEEDIQQLTAVPFIADFTTKEGRYAMARAVRIGEKKILRDVEQALSGFATSGTASNNMKRSAGSPGGGAKKKQRAG